MTQQMKSEYDQHLPVSSAELSAIIHSHEKLKRWNDQNEQALQGEPDATLIHNIRLTAAQIMLEEKAVSSQNFELMRAMNLFDRTISAREVVTAALDSAMNTATESITAQIKTLLTPPEPESMNLQHARTRTDEALALPSQLISSVCTVTHQVLQNPQAAYESLSRTGSEHISQARVYFAENMRSEHPGRAIGAMAGAGVTDIALNTLTPSKKMEWNTYATLLGEGSVLPPAKPFRDFSEKMTFSKTKWMEPEVDYQPSKRHGISSGVNNTWGLYFGIKAQEDRYAYGSGTEMFLSSIKVFHQNHISITRLTGFWAEGTLGTNHEQFMQAYKRGATLEQAARDTFTGKMAGKLGLTAVDASDLREAVAKKDMSKLMPFFSHPNWGAGNQMNQYSHVYSLAHGRPGLTVAPTVLPATLPDEMLNEIRKLPAHQQAAVMKQAYHNISTQTSSQNIDQVGDSLRK